jgi:hypothetical protein
MAGIWVRTDDTVVSVAPANEVIRGALDVEMNITGRAARYPIGINCIRPFGTGHPGVGRATLCHHRLTYVNVRACST